MENNGIFPVVKATRPQHGTVRLMIGTSDLPQEGIEAQVDRLVHNGTIRGGDIISIHHHRQSHLATLVEQQIKSHHGSGLNITEAEA